MIDLAPQRPNPTSRRDVLKGSVGLALMSGDAVTGAGAWARQRRPETGKPENIPIMRTIPRTAETIPAIGLGTFMTFDVEPGGRRGNLLEVTRRFWQAGGRVIDTSPLYGTAEVTVGQFVNALGIADQLFISNKVWATGDYLGDVDQASHSLEMSSERLWRDRIDKMSWYPGKSFGGIITHAQQALRSRAG